MEKLALIAGNGNFPFLFLSEAKNNNQDLIIIALKGETDEKIENFGYKVFWSNIGKLNTIIEIIKKNNVTKAIMCGQVIHTKLFTEIKLDFRAIKLLATIANKKTDSILGAVATELSKEGIELISSITFMGKWLPKSTGFLTSKKVSEQVFEDILFGLETAKKIAGLDIGQTVVVKDKAVVAVEGLEGTDECILRAYKLAGKEIVVAKVNKPNQDERFDVPVVGKKTFEILQKVGAACICFEAGKTLFFDKDECLKIADDNNIAVYGV